MRPLSRNLRLTTLHQLHGRLLDGVPQAGRTTIAPTRFGSSQAKWKARVPSRPVDDIQRVRLTVALRLHVRCQAQTNQPKSPASGGGGFICARHPTCSLPVRRVALFSMTSAFPVPKRRPVHKRVARSCKARDSTVPVSSFPLHHCLHPGGHSGFDVLEQRSSSERVALIQRQEVGKYLRCRGGFTDAPELEAVAVTSS